MRVLLDHGDPELPKVHSIQNGPEKPSSELHLETPDVLGDGFRGGSDFAGLDRCEGDFSQKQLLEMTAPVSDRSHDLCSLDHRSCDLQRSCDPLDHRSCDSRGHTERLVERLKKEEGDPLTQGRFDKTYPAPSLLKMLFEEFCVAANRAGFVVPSVQLFQRIDGKLSLAVQAIGVEGWREALALAEHDPLCCGKVSAGKGHEYPWRLTIEKMCDVDWVLGKLAEWRLREEKNVVCDADHMLLTPEHSAWHDWLHYFKENEPRKALLMENTGKWVVPVNGPPILKQMKNAM